MQTSVLHISSRYIAPLLVVLSLIVLYRGHNFPGGGFIGGLVAASAVLLLAVVHGWETVERRLRIDPLKFLVIGLGIALLSGLPGLLSGHPFMTGEWLPALELPLLGKLKLGTPLLFDVGVYLVVVGFTVKCAMALGKEND